MNWVGKAIKNEIKEQRGGFLSMLLGTLGASLLGNLLSGKGSVTAGAGFLRAGKGIKKALNPVHPLTNIEIEEYYKDEPRFNGVYATGNLPKTKNGAYVINLDEYGDVGTHWIALHVKNDDVKNNDVKNNDVKNNDVKNEVIYFDSLGLEYVPKEIKRSIGNKNMKTNIFRIQADNSIMCGYFVLD